MEGVLMAVCIYSSVSKKVSKSQQNDIANSNPPLCRSLANVHLYSKKKKIRTNELQYKNVTNHLTALLLFQCIVELTVQILTDTISDYDAGTASECHL